MKSIVEGRTWTEWCFTVVFILSCTSLTIDAKENDDPRLKAPWVASIFYKSPESGVWEYICGGTITSSSTVITSARCVSPRVSLSDKLSGRPYHFKYSNLKVVAGLLTSNFEAKDNFTQYAEVGQVRDLYSSSAVPDTPYQDLAALRLREGFNLTTPYVKAVLLTQFVNTITEVNATKPGDTVIIAGFEGPNAQAGIQTRSKSLQTLKVYEIELTDVSTCIERYFSSFDAFYFDILCGKSKSPNVPIPCRFQGAGMITKAVIDPQGKRTAQPELHLMGVYSSNTVLSASEGAIKIKNAIKTGDCSAKDLAFFTKLGYLGRWGISHDFCGKELAMCKNDKCRPWEDFCDGKVQCDDNSDENERMCQYNKVKN